MSFKNLIYSIFLILIPSLVMSQEICDNGIDDDGDGLIDLNDDTDCVCDGNLPGSFFVNNQICSAYPTFSMATDFQDGLSYQWFHDGVALVGETDIIYLASLPFIEGVYVLNVTTTNNCYSSVPYELINGSVSTDITDTICIDEVYIFNGNTISTPGTYYGQFDAANGCDSIVHLTLELHDCGDTIRNVSTQFRNQLIAAGVDQNGDSKIQYTEAENIDSLDISYDSSTPSWEYKISDIRGIEYFTNLVYLNCSNNSIHTLEIDTLQKLRHLECYSNNMSNLSLLALTNLEYLDIGGNSFSDPVDLSQNTQLKYFLNHFNREDVLDFSNNTNLIHIDLYRDLTIDSLNFNGLKDLKYLRITSADLNAIDLSDAVSLEEIEFRQVATEEEIDFTPFTELKKLIYTLSGVENIDLSKSTKLEYLNIRSNQLNALDVKENTNLYHIDCYDNLLLSNIDFSKNLELVTLDVQRCDLNDHILDLSNNSKLDTLRTHQVKELWIKNNSIERELDIWFDLWIEFVCCDEAQYDEVRELIYQDVPVSFDCGLVSSSNLHEDAVLLTPNIVSNTLTIQSTYSIKGIALFNAAGQQFDLAYELNASISQVDVSELLSGIYYLSVETINGKVVKKFVKR